MKTFKRTIAVITGIILSICLLGCNGLKPSVNGSENKPVSNKIPSSEGGSGSDELYSGIGTEITSFVDSGNNGLYISMYDISDVSEEIFTKNRGIPTYLCKETPADSFDSFLAYLEVLTANDDAMLQLEYLILGIDPELLDLNDDKIAQLKEFADVLGNRKVEVVYRTHPYTYWETEEEAFNSQFEQYQKCVRFFSRHFPAEQYYFASELFLLGNLDCYKDGSDVLVGNLADKMLLYSLCDGVYKVDHVNFDKEKTKLKKNLRNIENYSIPLKDKFKGESVIFLGDSIYGHYTHPTSIPSIFGSLTGAEGINCGVGGMSLINEDKYYRVDTLMKALTMDTPQNKTDFEIFKRSYIVKENEQDLITGKEYLSGGKEGLTVIIEFGINDYLFHYPAEDFLVAYDEFLTELDNNPSVKQVIPVLPPFPSETIGRSGKETIGNEGGIVEDYRDAIRIASDKHGYFFLDLAMIPEFAEDKEAYFLPDGIHYNENGRYVIARKMAEFMTRFYQ